MNIVINQQGIVDDTCQPDTTVSLVQTTLAPR